MAASAALSRAGLTPAQLGHINACASGNPVRDRSEAIGLRQLLGTDSRNVPVTAIKSYTGSAGSGSSLCELAASLLALQQGLIPRTLNFSATDTDTPLDVVHGEHRQASSGLFLKTSVTRMGQASAVVIKV
jgi:3-oxoacyl-[acyl-carrier-protein] synthase II